MTRKRFIKLAMSECMGRNEAVFAAEMSLLRFGSYERAYMELWFTIRDRFEFYMPGYEKRIAKRNKMKCPVCQSGMKYIEDKKAEKLGWIQMDCPNGCNNGYVVPNTNPKLTKE